MQEKLRLGNLDAKRDWGFAGDYVQAIWLMLQQDQPDDFVVATGVKHSVRDSAGGGLRPRGPRLARARRDDPRCFRLAEVNTLCGDAGKARRVLAGSRRSLLPS